LVILRRPLILDTTKHSDKNSRDEFYRRLKPDGKRLILSIDGGGTKGLMTLHCLIKLEELTGRPCHEIFDFYAGTSTGSIIAGGLAKKMSAQQILGHYRKFISRVFDDRKHGGLSVMDLAIDAAAKVLSLPDPKYKEYAKLAARNGFKYLYSHQDLKRIINEIIEGHAEPKQPTTLAQLYDASLEDNNKERTKRLLITIKDVRRSETLFAVNAGPGAKPFEDMPLVDAILASSVAPIFLEPYREWVDGGVGSFANPCYVATVEATEYFTGLLPNTSPERLKKRYDTKDDDEAYRHENVIHFSFGTGLRPNYLGEKREVKDLLFFDWLLYVISEGQDDANNSQVRLTEERFSKGNNWYTPEYHNKRVDFRRYQLFLDPATLTKSEGGLGMNELSADEAKLIRGLELSANSKEELAIMEKVGKAWADAIGKDFARPHSPYAQEPEAYQPPASPPRKVEPDLDEYLARIYPSDRGWV
jgi:predicted acylesterase/phospholipase RssA